MLINMLLFSRGRIVTKKKTARDVQSNQRWLLHPSAPWWTLIWSGRRGCCSGIFAVFVSNLWKAKTPSERSSWIWQSSCSSGDQFGRLACLALFGFCVLSTMKWRAPVRLITSVGGLGNILWLGREFVNRFFFLTGSSNCQEWNGKCHKTFRETESESENRCQLGGAEGLWCVIVRLMKSSWGGLVQVQSGGESRDHPSTCFMKTDTLSLYGPGIVTL